MFVGGASTQTSIVIPAKAGTQGPSRLTLTPRAPGQSGRSRSREMSEPILGPGLRRDDELVESLASGQFIRLQRIEGRTFLHRHADACAPSSPGQLYALKGPP